MGGPSYVRTGLLHPEIRTEVYNSVRRNIQRANTTCSIQNHNAWNENLRSLSGSLVAHEGSLLHEVFAGPAPEGPSPLARAGTSLE